MFSEISPSISTKFSRTQFGGNEKDFRRELSDMFGDFGRGNSVFDFRGDTSTEKLSKFRRSSVPFCVCRNCEGTIV